MKRMGIFDTTNIVTIVIISSLLFFTNQGSADPVLQIDEFVPYSVGDSLEYDINIDNMLADLVNENDYYYYYKDIETNNIISVTGVESLTLNDKSYDCWIISQQEEYRYTITCTDIEYEKINVEKTIVFKDWINKEAFNILKEERTYKMRYEAIYLPEENHERYVSEEESTGIKTFSEPASEVPFPLKVGKTWTNQNSYFWNLTTKSRYKYDNNEFSDWDLEYIQEEVSKSYIYEVISENENVVPAGTYKTLKIKKQAAGSQDHILVFKNRYGVTIQYETYEDGKLFELHKLRSYQYQNMVDEDNDGFIDINDDFPEDPNENTDTDGDGVGDNSDTDPLDPERSKTENDSSVSEFIDRLMFAGMGIICGVILTWVVMVMRPRREDMALNTGRRRGGFRSGINSRGGKVKELPPPPEDYEEDDDDYS